MKNIFINGTIIYTKLNINIPKPYIQVKDTSNYPIVIQRKKDPIPEKYSFIILCEINFAKNEINFAKNSEIIYPVPKPFGEDWAGFYPTEFSSAIEHKKLKEKLAAAPPLEESPYNPPVIVEIHNGFNVVRDDLLIGGTKQRGLIYYISSLFETSFKKEKKPLIYAGPPQGIAQVALAYIGQAKDIKTYMVYAAPSKKTPIHNMSKKALRYGVNLIWGGPSLSVVQEYGRKLAQKTGGILLPFGLDNFDFKYYLIRALRVACADLQKNPPRRMWLVVGSGVILNCLYHIFPTTYFMGVQVGKAIWWDMIDSSRTRIFIAPQKFVEGTDILPPYPSVSSYDAKLWQFIIKYGEAGDYIWNVANEL